jgi:hypothetical protein
MQHTKKSNQPGMNAKIKEMLFLHLLSSFKYNVIFNNTIGSSNIGVSCQDDGIQKLC